uniref:Uncharacterized protein n=1 Tax=Dicentrarchus labrax TaxID=13489 RepID=A0A8C4NNW2_DICLA
MVCSDVTTVLRYFLSALINKVQLVEKLSDSLPVRTAARLPARAALRVLQAGRAAAGRALESRSLRQTRQEAAEAPRGPGHLSRKSRRVRDSLLEDVRDTSFQNKGLKLKMFVPVEYFIKVLIPLK